MVQRIRRKVPFFLKWLIFCLEHADKRMEGHDSSKKFLLAYRMLCLLTMSAVIAVSYSVFIILTLPACILGNFACFFVVCLFRITI